MSSQTKSKKPTTALSRRGFFQGVGLGGGALGAGLQIGSAAVLGPGPVPITLQVNGKTLKLNLEPRVTLQEALHDHLEVTSVKTSCDRGTCGTCTVMLGGKAVNACGVLAIEAQGKEIQTVESLSTAGKAHPLLAAIVRADAVQCGFCAPGFAMAAKEFLQRHPNPTYDQVAHGLGGNLCRCGIYVPMRKAVLEAAKEMKGARNA